MIGRVSTQNLHYNAKPVAPPSDLFMATMLKSTNLTYLSNISSITFSTIDLQPYSSLQILNSHEILRYGNDIHIIGNYGSTSSYNLHTIKLKDCKLIKNRLLFQGFEERSLSSATSSYTEAFTLYNGYLYLTLAGNTTTPTKILRVNKDNLNDDITTLTLGINGQTRNIIALENYIYIFNTNGTGVGFVGSLIRVTPDLATYSVIFTTGAVSSARRVRYGSTFTISNNEIYIPMLNNVITGYNHQGLEVYNMTGVLQRATYSVPINSNASTLPTAKWMSVYNNKLIISNSTSLSTSSHYSLVRMNITTLVVEESIQINGRISDDNSIFSNGYIYLNGEAPVSNYIDGFNINTATVSEPTAKLIKIKYDDFTDLTYLTPSTWGYGSYGSINPSI